MLQVKKKAIYFHLLNNTISMPYALAYNIFYYNHTNLTYFNTCICKKGCRLHSRHPSTHLNTMKKPLIFLIGNTILSLAKLKR